MRISDWSSDVCSSDLEHFAEAALNDPQVLAVAKRINHSVNPTIDDGEFAAGDVSVFTTDGRKLHNVAPYALGHPLNPVSDTDLSAKLRECARLSAHPLSAEDIARIEHAVDRKSTRLNSSH